MAVDEPRDVSSTLPVRHKVKSTIVYAAIMIADYKLRHGDYALMKLGLSRGEIKPFLDSIKRLFPFEDAFAIDEEISKYKLRFQIGMPNQGTNAILGLRPVPRPPRTADAQFRARLNLMLDAFTGSTIRNATHDADLVCCWASMCKIKYKYSPTDTLPVALTKVIRALRQQGIAVYNFLVSSPREQDIDHCFSHYAAAHPQHNATNKAYFRGLPIFTGHADTLRHFFGGLMVEPEGMRESPLAVEPSRVGIRRVLGAMIQVVVPLQNRLSAVKTLSLAMSRGADNMMFVDSCNQILSVLASVPDSQLENRMLVIAVIPTEENSESRCFRAWAICTYSLFWDLFIAREEINGTLVLARSQKDGNSIRTSIAAYLTITDQQSGTFLIPVSAAGQIELTLKTPQRSDMGNSNLMNDRKLCAKLKFAESNDISGIPKQNVFMIRDHARTIQLFAFTGPDYPTFADFPEFDEPFFPFPHLPVASEPSPDAQYQFATALCPFYLPYKTSPHPPSPSQPSLARSPGAQSREMLGKADQLSRLARMG
jgi:hypothetical protein